MSSTRCPGKVLRIAGGKPLLGWLLDGLSGSHARGRSGSHTGWHVVVATSVDESEQIDPRGLQRGADSLDIVVATSVHESDDAIADYCLKRDTKCFRGPLEDVTLRLLQASRGRGSHFIRLCADSPLIDAGNIHRAIGFGIDSDLVTNTPAAGNSAELVRHAALAEAYPHMSAEEREHVTLFFYRHSEDYTIRRFRSEGRILVDTEEDWERFRQTVS